MRGDRQAATVTGCCLPVWLRLRRAVPYRGSRKLCSALADHKTHFTGIGCIRRANTSVATAPPPAGSERHSARKATTARAIFPRRHRTSPFASRPSPVRSVAVAPSLGSANLAGSGVGPPLRSSVLATERHAARRQQNIGRAILCGGRERVRS